MIFSEFVAEIWFPSCIITAVVRIGTFDESKVNSHSGNCAAVYYFSLISLPQFNLQLWKKEGQELPRHLQLTPAGVGG